LDIEAPRAGKIADAERDDGDLLLHLSHPFRYAGACSCRQSAYTLPERAPARFPPKWNRFGDKKARQIRYAGACSCRQSAYTLPEHAPRGNCQPSRLLCLRELDSSSWETPGARHSSLSVNPRVLGWADLRLGLGVGELSARADGDRQGAPA